MEATKSFEDLTAWKKAHEFVISVYKFSDLFPDKERFGLTSQLRRASISIAANIAEGYKKQSVKDKLRYFNISQGSIEECRYYLILSKDLGYLSSDATLGLENLLNDSSRLLNAYCKAILNNQ